MLTWQFPSSPPRTMSTLMQGNAAGSSAHTHPNTQLHVACLRLRGACALPLSLSDTLASHRSFLQPK